MSDKYIHEISEWNSDWTFPYMYVKNTEHHPKFDKT